MNDKERLRLKELKLITENTRIASKALKESSFSNHIALVAMFITSIIATIGIFLSWQSFRISKSSLKVAQEVREDSRKIAKLDLKPEIKFDIQFKTINNIPPHLIIANVGAVEAVQVIIDFISHRYDGENFMSISNTENRYKIEELKPLDTKSFVISEHFLKGNARLGEPLESNVIEARIFYKSKPDLELFVKRAFYFISPEGLWVSEIASSVKSKYYLEIKEALLNHYWNFPLMRGDVLHDVDLEKLIQ